MKRSHWARSSGGNVSNGRKTRRNAQGITARIIGSAPGGPESRPADACCIYSRVSVFDELEAEYEEVVFFHDPPTGLKAIVAIHSTALGPALGGTRFWPFESEAEALRDVLRLSRGMTYKAAAAGLDLGGGKAVIIGDPKR